MMYDVAIIGKGLIGTLLAISLKQAMPTLRICIIDKNKETATNNRALALSMPTVKLLKHLNIWNDDCTHNSGKISTIAVGMTTECPTPLAFEAHETLLGYNIPYTTLSAALNSALETLTTLDFELGAPVAKIDFKPNYATVDLEHTTLSARLIIGADGRNSFLRENYAQFKTIQYKQTAFTTQVNHTLPHNNTAYEFFLPQGALAFIPLKSPHASTLVWSLKDALTPTHTEIEAILKQIAVTNLGEVSLINPLHGYPLNSYVSTQRSGSRWLLVGDAATTVHPVAGQGFNLGVRDVIVLTRHLKEQFALGLDLGSQTFLKHYEKQRKLDQYALVGITYFSGKTLTTPNTFLRSIFNRGMQTTQKLSFLSDFLNHRAQMGF